jgi:hypothetical protein
VEWNEQRTPVFLHTRGRLCFCCWHLLYFTTDCTRSTVKFWFLRLDIFPLSFSRHRRLVRFALVHFSICSGPISLVRFSVCIGPVCPCPFVPLAWTCLVWSGLHLSIFQSALVRFALVRFSICTSLVCPCPFVPLAWTCPVFPRVRTCPFCPRLRTCPFFPGLRTCPNLVVPFMPLGLVQFSQG